MLNAGSTRILVLKNVEEKKDEAGVVKREIFEPAQNIPQVHLGL